MPELPEVEVSRQGISPWLTGIKVTRVVVRDGRLRWPVPGEIQELVDLVIHRVSRRAKYLLLETDFGTAILHLGMSGSLRVLDIGTPAEKHDHVDIELANGKLHFMRQGKIFCTAPTQQAKRCCQRGQNPNPELFHTGFHSFLRQWCIHLKMRLILPKSFL